MYVVSEWVRLYYTTGYTYNTIYIHCIAVCVNIHALL